MYINTDIRVYTLLRVV